VVVFVVAVGVFVVMLDAMVVMLEVLIVIFDAVKPIVEQVALKESPEKTVSPEAILNVPGYKLISGFSVDVPTFRFALMVAVGSVALVSGFMEKLYWCGNTKLPFTIVGLLIIVVPAICEMYCTFCPVMDAPISTEESPGSAEIRFPFSNRVTVEKTSVPPPEGAPRTCDCEKAMPKAFGNDKPPPVCVGSIRSIL